ncbi:unnamed protein product [Paramecium pentaurelia]|uniref:PIN domain-containing protein n=1 Tax=Paramecium pentaurelia TaxID=43138 RepID=A0A8S1VAM4_9CILI|nr:unnamed protein product [Paramecium pentaurelia]
MYNLKKQLYLWLGYSLSNQLWKLVEQLEDYSQKHLIKYSINSFVRLLEQEGKSANPFCEFLNQTMKAANLNHKPITQDELRRIMQKEKLKVLIVTEDQDILDKVTQERFSKLRINKYSINNAQCQK